MSANSLFPNVAIKVNISDVNSLEFSWFVNSPNILNEEFRDVVQSYCNKQKSQKQFYHLSVEYNTMTKDKRFRFMLVSVGEQDEVFIPYKIIQILKTKQIRFFGFPLSKNGIAQNEKMVYDLLKGFKFARFVFTLDDGISDDVKRLVEYDDYYYTLNDKSAIYTTGRYRSSNYINKLFKSQNVNITFGNIADYSSFESLRKLWKTGMKERGSSVSTIDDQLFTNITKSYNSDLRFICIYHRNELVSLQVFLCNISFQYADCLYIHHIWDAKCDDERKKIMANIVEIQKFLSWKYLFTTMNITRVYLAGCRPTEKRLLAHKERISDGKVKYYIL